MKQLKFHAIIVHTTRRPMLCDWNSIIKKMQHENIRKFNWTLTLVIMYCWQFNINILIHGNKQHSLGSRSACRCCCCCCWCWESANIIQRHSTHLFTIHNIYFYTLTHPITYILLDSFSDHISERPTGEWNTHTQNHVERFFFHSDAHKSKTCLVILCPSKFWILMWLINFRAKQIPV